MYSRQLFGPMFVELKKEAKEKNAIVSERSAFKAPEHSCML
jgi:hypothetical protein